MKSFLHLVELEGLDDRLDLLHRPRLFPPRGPTSARLEHNLCQRPEAMRRSELAAGRFQFAYL
jgi:hypothetical protein